MSLHVWLLNTHYTQISQWFDGLGRHVIKIKGRKGSAGTHQPHGYLDIVRDKVQSLTETQTQKDMLTQIVCILLPHVCLQGISDLLPRPSKRSLPIGNNSTFSKQHWHRPSSLLFVVQRPLKPCGEAVTISQSSPKPYMPDF